MPQGNFFAYGLLARLHSQLFHCLPWQRTVASQLVFTECQVLLIFTPVLQRRSYYPVLQIKKQADRWIFPSPYDCGSFRIWTYTFSGEGQCSCQMDSCQVRPRSLDSGPLGQGYKWTSLLPLLCDLINEFFKLCNTYWHLPYLKHCIKYFKCLINSQ